MGEQAASLSKNFDSIILSKSTNVESASKKFRLGFLLAFTLLSICTRFYGISNGSTVVYENCFSNFIVGMRLILGNLVVII